MWISREKFIMLYVTYLQFCGAKGAVIVDKEPACYSLDIVALHIGCSIVALSNAHNPKLF